MFQAMTAAVAAPATPVVPEKRRMAPPSSDPVDQDDIQYRTIQEFLSNLGKKHPQRGLIIFATNFKLMDYWHVDELAKMSQEDLTTADFGMTPGNTNFVIKAARAEVKQTGRGVKRARYKY